MLTVLLLIESSESCFRFSKTRAMAAPTRITVAIALIYTNFFQRCDLADLSDRGDVFEEDVDGSSLL